MGEARLQAGIPLLLVLLLLGMSQSSFTASLLPNDQNTTVKHAGSDPGVNDVPTWRVGDKWVYSGTFDPSILITDTGVSANVGEINGDSTAEVTEILELQVDNGSEWVYKLRMTADFDKSGVELEGFTGNAEIQFTQTEYLRVSDFASIRNDLDLYIKFVPYGIGSLTQILGDITITNTYSPGSETYDFPIRDGERWTVLTTSSATWSGQSDYITPFPPPESDTNTTTWEVTKVGQPRNDFGSGIAYSGCDASYELTSWNSDGVSTGYRWYCPAVNNFAWRHSEEDVGLTIDFRLKQYMPVGATGSESNSDPGTRPECIEVQPERTLTALDTPLDVWVSLNPSCFGTINGVNVDLDFSDTETSLITGSNGSGMATINVGNALDYSSTNTDWASHGVVAKAGNYVGSATVTLDEYLVGLDLIADEERAVITRNRSGELSTVSSLSGYNVLPGDELIVEVAVVNKGITASTPTQMRIYHPDGSIFDLGLPSLATYESHKVNFTWTVPLDKSIGDVPIRWEADPMQVNSADADSDNDLAEITLFVGRLPTALAEPIEELTNVQTVINASGSFDEDGGDVSCLFNIPYDDGTRTYSYVKIESIDCMLNFTWTDDGIYPVEITVTDEELDQAVMTLNVSILNRAPNIEVVSARTEVKVEHPVTLYAYANDTDSEDVYPGVVDVYWPNAECEEGYYTRVCTTTAPTEGWHTFLAVGVDDDSAMTSASIDIRFTNINPHGLSVTVSEDGVPIPMDVQQTWHVEEDQLVRVRGQALDSIDDLEGLTHRWWPDDAQPNLIKTFDGRVSEYDMVWETSGLHRMRLEVSDSEGASSGTYERWINVANVAPIVMPLEDLLPIAEGEEIRLTGNATDTPSDYDSLVRCWDVDPGIDSNDIGGADDDCDVRGDELVWHWNRSGMHTVVYHVTDDDGVRVSEIITVEVLNIPPIVRYKPIDCLAYENCILDATGTIDSENDLDQLTIIWDLDTSFDSNGDGVKNNDADAVGKRIEHMFKQTGSTTIRVMAWDENPERPGSKIININVGPPDRTFTEDIGALMVGEEANPLAQLSLLLLLLLGLGYMTRQRRKGGKERALERLDERQNAIFSDEEVGLMPHEVSARRNRPHDPPVNNAFDQAIEQQPKMQSGPELPESGLPEGWTMEQWGHYGQQWLESQSEN
tara:strand:+ start:867 stop:4367 length:3501 start_codon:yes stop_codon:yes gene_type:complete